MGHVPRELNTNADYSQFTGVKVFVTIRILRLSVERHEYLWSMYAILTQNMKKVN